MRNLDRHILRRVHAFTLAEVLAALVLMAIVIPVAIEGTGVAGRAGELGVRKADAVRVAQRVLNESIATGAAQQSTSGNVAEDHTNYAWTLTSQPWSVDTMQLVTVQVTFNLQGRDFDVSLDTLVDPAATSSAAGTSSAL
jgi:type II secretory pathway pseudopilin PulG